MPHSNHIIDWIFPKLFISMPVPAFESPGLLMAIMSAIALIIAVLYRGYRARRFYRDLVRPTTSNLQLVYLTHL